MVEFMLLLRCCMGLYCSASMGLDSEYTEL